MVSPKCMNLSRQSKGTENYFGRLLLSDTMMVHDDPVFESGVIFAYSQSLGNFPIVHGYITFRLVS